MPDETSSQRAPLSRQVPNSEVHTCGGEDQHRSWFVRGTQCPFFHGFGLLTLLALEFEPMPRRYSGCHPLSWG